MTMTGNMAELLDLAHNRGLRHHRNKSSQIEQENKDRSGGGTTFVLPCTLRIYVYLTMFNF